MAIVGSPNLWAGLIEEKLIPEILNMVVDAWSSFIKPESNELEVPLTRRFRIELERHRDLIRLPVRIEREVSIDDPATAQELGRIDLCFTTCVVRSDVYFAFECKRLNVLAKNGKISPRAGEYVGTGGMMCFVDAQPQYARGLHQSGMIGYVMDGEVEKAIRAVDKQIKKKYVKLQMEKSKTGLLPSSKTSKSFVKESLHYLPDRELTLHHIFLPVS